MVLLSRDFLLLLIRRAVDVRIVRLEDAYALRYLTERYGLLYEVLNDMALNAYRLRRTIM